MQTQVQPIAPTDPTWWGLTSALTPEELSLIETAVVDEMLANPLNATLIDAAIILSSGRYFLRQRIEEQGAIVHRLRPISPETLSAIFNNDQHDTGWLPEGVKRAGRSVKGTWAVYAINAGLHTIEVLLDQQSQKWRVPLPAMLWLGLEDKYWLFAVRGKLTPDAKLYRVPLTNVDEQGVVCFGQNTIPKANARTIVDAWKLFIEAPFNGHSGTSKSREFPTMVLRQLQQLHQAHARHYPLDDLIPDDRRSATVDSIIAHLLLDPSIPRNYDELD